MGRADGEADGDTDGNHVSNFPQDIADSRAENILCALAAGVVFNGANLLIVAGIDMVGLAVAFPVAVGTALVMGTILNYILQPEGQALLLFLGVGLAVLAVCSMSYAYHVKNRDSEEDFKQIFVDDFDDQPRSSVNRTPRAQPSKLRGLVVCVVGGFFMGLWSPLSTHSMLGDHRLSPYGSTVLFTAALIISTFPFNLFLSAKPLSGDVAVSVSEYREGHWSWHVLAWFGGAVWTVGTLFNLIAGKAVGFAASYAIGQSAPLIATFWGVVAFREMKGAPVMTWVALVAMVLLYGGAITCIALGT
eukprot:CAMPEP_0175851394 /NCGR_PEP_ID=MMETSP0107_2-20121207/25628_1 /TAXON_ID=195067 ORGANISM="Goniomonas pacifica, Strain CCMP1869" /NCGR_SAMPLE_ID=MMETSP0107_2 /ASSEMBLY_ACC=CAM_ASM_000203 /LENGTH=303 /DNA_ID=CAMNT_0017166803 /DNA_START=146 /DNA_END=1057 /DNA_ORIENTATION=-